MIPPFQSVLADAREVLDRLRAELINDRADAPHWTGTLAASPLSTATAVSALATVRQSRIDGGSRGDGRLGEFIDRGVRYLVESQNADGGFGDTDRSYSNVATTMLALAALRLAGCDSGTVLERAQGYVERAGGIAALRRRYGTDKTFVVPILTNCALAGMVPWSEVAALPFEAAAVPQSLYRLVRMPVVSYAIPALVAIGQARWYHAPPRNPAINALRRRLVGRTTDVLERMQPASGGYLEATPLTSFVLMSLASTERADHPVAKRAVDFLQSSMLEDGSWPIDTNLATWLTSLSVHALATDPEDDRSWASAELVQWMLGCQHSLRHPFTGAEPGGWGWTDLSGAVPDGDDTPAAILALAQFAHSAELDLATRRGIGDAVQAGTEWLRQLQNRDGGIPTFCRGWGRLPFDRSSTDLTAHTLRAYRAAATVLGEENRRQTARSARKGTRYLLRAQQPDGSWLPLWFGNQDNPDDINPVYGTGRVLVALAGEGPAEARAARRGADYLVRTQNSDGGWGGGRSLARWQREGSVGSQDTQPGEGATAGHAAAGQDARTGEDGASSIEETAVALEGLAKFWQHRCSEGGQDGGEPPYRSAIIRATAFLCESIRQERHRDPWPIGFYFAKLWYHERLYPTIFATAALGTVLRVFGQPGAGRPAVGQ